VVSTGSTGVIEMNGSELRMFSIDGSNENLFAEVPETEELDNKKVYYIHNGVEFVSADTSHGFQKDENGKRIKYYEYKVSP
jgi:hypothetical protein